MFGVLVFFVILAAIVALEYHWHTILPPPIYELIKEGHEAPKSDKTLTGTYHYEVKLENCTDGKAHSDAGLPSIDSSSAVFPIRLPEYMSIYRASKKDKQLIASGAKVPKKKKAKKKTKKKTNKGKNK